MTNPETHRLRLKLAVEDLCSVLGRLHGHHQRLHDVLVDKESALIEVEMSRLDDCQNREEELLRELIEEEKDRLLVTEEIGDLLDHDEPASIRVAEILPHLDEPLADRLRGTREELRSTALDLARRNSVNRALIEHSLGHVQLFLSKLVNEELSDHGYGQLGKAPSQPAAKPTRPFLMDRRI